MSYCRSDGKTSDVYVFGSATHLECHSAWEAEMTTPVHKNGGLIEEVGVVYGPLTFATTSYQELYDHLKEHEKAGHRVPNYVFRELQADAIWYMDDYNNFHRDDEERTEMWTLNDGTKLLLLTEEAFHRLEDGTEVISIHGQRAIKGVDRIDEDTRYGYMAWGVEPPPVHEWMKRS